MSRKKNLRTSFSILAATTLAFFSMQASAETTSVTRSISLGANGANPAVKITCTASVTDPTFNTGPNPGTGQFTYSAAKVRCSANKGRAKPAFVDGTYVNQMKDGVAYDAQVDGFNLLTGTQDERSHWVKGTPTGCRALRVYTYSSRAKLKWTVYSDVNKSTTTFSADITSTGKDWRTNFLGLYCYPS
jgi:hypothetical protein